MQAVIQSRQDKTHLFDVRYEPIVPKFEYVIQSLCIISLAQCDYLACGVLRFMDCFKLLVWHHSILFAW